VRGDYLPKKCRFLPFEGRVPTPGTDWREILLRQAHPRAPRLCQISHESVQRVTHGGENADFWPVSKFNTGSLPLRGIMPVNTVRSLSKVVQSIAI